MPKALLSSNARSNGSMLDAIRNASGAYIGGPLRESVAAHLTTPPPKMEAPFYGPTNPQISGRPTSFSPTAAETGP